MTRILVFDSGVGGLSIADAIVAAGLDAEIDYVADNAWLPYGEKSDADLRARVPAVIAAAAARLAPDVVVVACNTASTIALDAVRATLSIPVVGVVPPIKPAAAQSRTRVIGLLATPATVRRPYTDDLIARHAADVRVVRYGSSALVLAAEARLAGRPADPSAIKDAVDGLFGAPGGGDIDAVALACTHFPLLVDALRAAAPRPALWLDSGAAVARRTRDVSGARDGVARPGAVWCTDAARCAALTTATASRGYMAARALAV
ncbi:MAG: glutamate racemase [Hyphomonadaceae bacterium]|nr:glutamate racemase [Hyphomonadaceae bacterium]